MPRGPKEEGILNSAGKAMLVVFVLAALAGLAAEFGSDIVREIEEAAEEAQETTVEDTTIESGDLGVPEVPATPAPEQPFQTPPASAGARDLERRAECISAAAGDIDAIQRCLE